MDGVALILCEGKYGTVNGKTAHGLVRFTKRYTIRGVIDSTLAGRDAGEALDGKRRGIPIVASLDEGLRLAGEPVTHVVVGVATAGGKLPSEMRAGVADALRGGLNVDSGLHEFLGDDPEFAKIAASNEARIRDVRKTPPRSELHFYTGKISEVSCPRIAVLGTDCASGKRTTAWFLVQAMEKTGLRAEMVGTGQTAWMQGAKYGTLLDSLVNDFVSGEIEHAVWSAWNDVRPDLIVIEGQGTLIHPAMPGGFEILGAGQPTAVVLQHIPGRKELEGTRGVPVAPPPRHIEVIRLITGTPTIAVTLSREGLRPSEWAPAMESIARETGLPVFDPLSDEGTALAAHVAEKLGLRR
jgi:uncharacterized NAD-dependent epimerase/dehydratase family protein